jgi:hypothetical protein
MAALDVTFQSIQTYTVQDFLRILDRLPPTDPGRYELIDGRIVMAPPASSEHGRTESRIAGKLSTYVFVRDLGEPFGSSAGFILPSGDLVQPDFAFVSKERFQDRPLPESTFERSVPNLVVEILSPSTARIDLNEKNPSTKSTVWMSTGWSIINCVKSPSFIWRSAITMEGPSTRQVRRSPHKSCRAFIARSMN